MAIIQIKRGTAAEWDATNPILALAELGLETDTNKMKAGDGVTAWSGLVYVAGDGGGSGGAVTSVNGKVGIVQLDKGDIGLGVVDNTSDADKPISTATQTALDGLNKSDIGLGEVDNTSDADKPISTATQTALDTKAQAGDFTTLAGRVTSNEVAIQTNTGNITTNTANITTNTGDITTLQTESGYNTGAITTLDGRVTTNEGNISTNTGNIATNTTDISTNTGNIATNAGNIATNTTDISTNTGNIATNTTDISTNTGNISAKIGSLAEDTTPQLGGDLDLLGFTMTSSTAEVTTDKDFQPTNNGTQDLGADTNRWKDIYVKDGVDFTDKRNGADAILSIRGGQIILTNSTDEVTTAVDLGGTTPDPGHFRNVELDGTGRYTVGPSTLLNTNGLITREFINTPGQFFVINDIDGGSFTGGNRQCFGLVRETMVDGTDFSGVAGTSGTLMGGGNSGGWSLGGAWYYTAGYPYIWTTYSVVAQTPAGSGEGYLGTFSGQTNQKKWWEACTLVGVGKKIRVGIADGTNSDVTGLNLSNRLVQQLWVPQEVIDDAAALALLPASVATYGEGWYTAWGTSGDYENMGQFPDSGLGYGASRQAGVDKGYRFRWSTFGNTTLNQLPYLQGVPSVNDQIAAATGLSYYLVYEPTAADKAAANVTLATGTTAAENPFYVSKEVVLLQFQQPYTSFETAAANIFEINHTDVGAVQSSPLFITYPLTSAQEILEAGLSVQGIESIRATVSEIVLQAVIGYYMVRQLDSTDRATVRSQFATIMNAANTGQLQEVYDLVSLITADPLYPQELLDALLERTSFYLKNYPVF